MKPLNPTSTHTNLVRGTQKVQIFFYKTQKAFPPFFKQDNILRDLNMIKTPWKDYKYGWKAVMKPLNSPSTRPNLVQGVHIKC